MTDRSPFKKLASSKNVVFKSNLFQKNASSGKSSRLQGNSFINDNLNDAYSGERMEIEMENMAENVNSNNYLTLKENTSKNISKDNQNMSPGKLKKNPSKRMTSKHLNQEGKPKLVKSQTLIQTEPDHKIEEEILDKKTFRQVLDSCLSTNKRKQNLQVIICFISLFSSLLYIACTYFNEIFIYLDYLDYGVCFIYFCEYVVNFCLAHHRFNFVISTDSILDLLTLIPPFFSSPARAIPNNDLMKFINISRVLRIIRFFRIFSIYKSGENDVNKQIWMIINTLIMLVLICSGIIQIVESDEVAKRLSLTTDTFDRNMLEMRTSFHHYIYFILVTISTVGYGDIIPYTIIGKLIVMGLILFTLVLIPKQTNDLIQLMSAQSEYARKKYTASQDLPHIILTGDISMDSLKSFCQELFHPDHGTQYRHAVIINSSLPSREMELFLNEKGNENKVFYLEGDPMNEKDLIRADIGKARACIIFNNKNSQDSYSSDHQNLLLGLYIKKFVYHINHETDNSGNKDKNSQNGDSPPTQSINTNFRLCIQLIKPESKYHYFNALQSIYKKRMPPDQLILIEEIKMNLLSKSCITPGILALISNLLMSSSSLPHGTDTEWLKEYAEGRGHEIYRIQLNENYKYLNFLDIVREVYSQEQAVVFAIEFEIDKTTVIKLNPGATLPISTIISNLIGSHSNFRDTHIQSNIHRDNNSDYNHQNSNNFNHPSSSEDYFNEKYIDAKVKVYVYLICEDKSVADNLVSKEKEDKKKNLYMSMGYGSTIGPQQVETKRKTRIILPNFDIDSDKDSNNSEIEQNNFFNGIGEDFEISNEDYYINDNIKNEYIIDTNIDIMQHTIKDSEEINQHVIICGIHPALIHFILPLRAKYLGEDNLKYIVILAPHLPQNLYDSFTRFPKIIFIQGSPLLPENLYRANIMNADKAVILSLGESKVDKLAFNSMIKTKADSEDQMLDAETIFIYKAIKKCNKNIQIMTELISTSNIEYLLHKNYLNASFFRQDFLPLYEYTPLFASGEVFTPAIIDRITCQSYYSPHILTILDQLLNGGSRGKNRKIKKLEEELKLQGSNLWLVRVPEALINETFEELFKHLITSHKVVAIGLYRKNNSEDFYYVYTNPKKTTLINEMDLVFVLGQYNNIIDLFEDRDEGFFYKKNKPLYKKIKNQAKEKLNEESSDYGDDEKACLIDKNLKNTVKTKLEKFSDKALNRMDGVNKVANYTNTTIEKTDTSQKTIEQGTNLDKITMKRKQSIAQFRGSVFKNFPVKDAKRGSSIENKKEINSSKYIEIEKIKTRLTKIQNDIERLKDSYNNLPRELENFINNEIENEFNIYLDKNENVSI